MNGSFLLAQAANDAIQSPAATRLNPQQASSLINISALLLIGPMVILIGLIAYVLINSPLGAPLFKPMAEQAFRKKQYAKAAKLYIKLNDLLELMEGSQYARKAAQCFELGGNLREALRWYEKADDWTRVGQLLMEAGDYDKAAEVFAAHQLPAKLAHCYEQSEDFLRAGDVYEFQLKNLHKAEFNYKKAAGSPDKETLLEAKLRLARVYHRLTRSEDARGAFDDASREIASSPQYQEFPDLLNLQRDVRDLLSG